MEEVGLLHRDILAFSLPNKVTSYRVLEFTHIPSGEIKTVLLIEQKKMDHLFIFGLQSGTWSYSS